MEEMNEGIVTDNTSHQTPAVPKQGPLQVRFTLAVGSGKPGLERRERWLRAATKIVGDERGALMEWIRRVCDQAAFEVLREK